MRAETAFRILGILRAAYPGREHDAQTAQAYIALLADLEDDLAERAVLALCRTKKFFPSVAEIIAEAIALRDPTPTPGEAWEAVLTAVRRGEHRNGPPLSLPPFVMEVVAGIGGLTAVAATESIETVQAHFFHRYEEAAEKRARHFALAGAPTSLRELEARMKTALPAGAAIASLGAKLGLPAPALALSDGRDAPPSSRGKK